MGLDSTYKLSEMFVVHTMYQLSYTKDRELTGTLSTVGSVFTYVSLSYPSYYEVRQRGDFLKNQT